MHANENAIRKTIKNSPKPYSSAIIPFNNKT